MTHTKVCMSGLTTTGLTTLATILAKRHKFFHVSASNTLLDATQQDHGCTERSPDSYVQYFWSTKETQSLYWELFNKRAANVSTDQAIDMSLLHELDIPRNSLIESLTSSLLAPSKNSAFHIRLRAPLSERVRRVSLQMPMLSVAKLTEMVLNKDLKTRDIILRAWGIDLTAENQWPHYDLIIDDAGFSAIFGNIRDREKEVSAKADVCSAFIEMYGHIATHTINIDVFNQASLRCRQALLRFGPIIRMFPQAFLHPEQAIKLARGFRYE